MNKINVVIIGYGSWGKRIVEKLYNNSNYNILGIITKSGVQLDSRFKFSSVLEDFLFFCDLVYIASPPKTHYLYVTKAIMARKHILCEKPFCTSLDEINKILMMVRLNSFNKILLVNYQHQMNLDLLKFIENIKILWENERKNIFFEINSCGPIIHEYISRKRDYGSHAISIARMIIKKMKLTNIKWLNSMYFHTDDYFISGSLNWSSNVNRDLSIKVKIGNTEIFWRDDNVKFDSVGYLFDLIPLCIDCKVNLNELNNINEAKYIEKVLLIGNGKKI